MQNLANSHSKYFDKYNHILDNNLLGDSRVRVQADGGVASVGNVLQVAGPLWGEVSQRQARCPGLE